MYWLCLWLTQIYTEFPFLEVRLFLPCTITFFFCLYCELALETWAKGFSIKPVWVYDLCHAHCNDQGSLTSKCCSRLKPVYSVKKEPLQSQQKSLSTSICVKKVRNGTASADQSFSTASQDSYACPPPPIPPFFASAKAIFKTDFSNW